MAAWATRVLTGAGVWFGVVASASAFAGQPSGTANAHKYRDAGLRSVIVASGGATLEVRALLARDGTATLEVTTGSLDAGTTGARIEKLQVKWQIGRAHV